MQNFRALEAPPPDPRVSGGWGFHPQAPKSAPPLRISGYVSRHSLIITAHLHTILPICRDFLTMQVKKNDECMQSNNLRFSRCIKRR